MRLLIDALAASGDPAAPAVLQAWGDKGLGLRKADGAYLLISPDAAGFALQDLTGAGWHCGKIRDYPIETQRRCAGDDRDRAGAIYAV